MSGRLLSSMFLALFEDSDFGAVANGLTSPSFEIVDKKYMNEKESLKVNIITGKYILSQLFTSSLETLLLIYSSTSS